MTQADGVPIEGSANRWRNRLARWIVTLTVVGLVGPVPIGPGSFGLSSASAAPSATPPRCPADDQRGYGCLRGRPEWADTAITPSTSRVGDTISITITPTVPACGSIPSWERSTKVCNDTVDWGGIGPPNRYIDPESTSLIVGHAVSLSYVPTAGCSTVIGGGIGGPMTCQWKLDNFGDRPLAEDWWSATGPRVTVSVPDPQGLFGYRYESFQAEALYYIVPESHTPEAEFTSTRLTSGRVAFSSTSTDPDGDALDQSWDFGDGTNSTAHDPAHTYAKPGTYRVTLTVEDPDGHRDSVSHDVVIAAPTLGVSIALRDGAAPPLETGKAVKARVTVSASADGLGSLSKLKFDTSVLQFEPEVAFDLIGAPSPTPDPGGFTLAPGTSKSFDVQIMPVTFGSYRLVSRVMGRDAADRAVTAEGSSRGVIGAAIAVTITLDPSQIEQEENDDEPKPIDIEAKIKIENKTDGAISDMNLRSLDVERVVVAQPLAIRQTGGVQPDPIEGYPLGDLGPGEAHELTATFTADDDGEIDFSALVTGASEGGGNLRGLGRARLSVKPQKLLGFTASVSAPVGGALLPAGRSIRIRGEIKNLSNTATLTVGPVIPETEGNAGLAGITYTTSFTDPRGLEYPDDVELGPGESKPFTVSLTTAYSDPRGRGGVAPHGGTRAQITFTPWALADLEDGTTVFVKPEMVKAKPEALHHEVSIDDSIPLPPSDPVYTFGAISAGGVEGIYSFAVGTLWSIPDLLKLPYTALRAATEFGARVWEAFTPAEKEAFAANVAGLTVAVLLRSGELAQQDIAALIKQAKAVTLASMTELENEWHTGDFASTAQVYSRYGTEAIANVAVPIALAKMAKSPQAAAALTRARDALVARMAPVLAEARTVEKLEQLGPLLTALENGVQLVPEDVAIFYGISPAEVAELQKLANKYRFLLTVRSRHASSIEWLRKGAVLKPERLKIKSVSELDVRLGYDTDQVGSLVFKKPQPLVDYEFGGGSLDQLTEGFVRSKGFTPGTAEYQNAIKRMEDRIKEWKKHEKEYKFWSQRGWIDVSFNWTGNGVFDPVRKGSGKQVGFRLRPIGNPANEEYIVELWNARAGGKWGPVTGDIDPIAFTHWDGSPLTMEEHADLLDDMAKNPLLQTQHGESATYVNGGVDFVVGQFKPGEPGLQFAPFDNAPRVVRLNPELSRWARFDDYNLHWDGSVIHAGGEADRAIGPFVRPSFDELAVLPPTPAPAPVPLPVSGQPPVPPTRSGVATRAVRELEPNFGRCAIAFVDNDDAPAIFIAADGRLTRLTSEGDRVSTWNSVCFTEGPIVGVRVRPSNQTASTAAAGSTQLTLRHDEYLADPSSRSFGVGAEIVVGVGTDHAETRRVVATSPLRLDRSFRFDHARGEVVISLRSAEVGAGGGPTTTVPPTTAPPTTGPATTAPGTTAPPTSSVNGAATTTAAGSLPRTGNDDDGLAAFALLLIALGALGIRGSHRRSRAMRRTQTR